MHQNLHRTHTTPNCMSSSHSHTAVDDEDDLDICPVCDGQCTCRTLPHSTAELKCPSTPPPPPPPFKITFTLPPNLIAKFTNKSLTNSQRTTSASVTDAYTKKRGRAPKLSNHPKLQPEEEIFIVADIHDKARLRKELLGGDDPHLKKRSYNSDWIIRPRKKSVGGSDAEQMDVDSDPENESENDDQDEDNDNDEDEDDEDDEPDGMNGVEKDDDDTAHASHHYVGLATGWSEEDESSFDADLFFANLSDSSSSTSSTRSRRHSYTPGDIDADQSSSISDSRPTKTGLPFEVTENWDGQLIFTNGLGEAESRGIVDIDFERNAERFIIDSDAADDHSCSSSSSSHRPYHPSFTIQSSDIDMFSISDIDAGYEEEDGGEAGEGDTTDEDPVGDDGLPNERSMSLFTLPMPMGMGMPMNVSAINPMSTVSPTIGVEKRRHRRVNQDTKRTPRTGLFIPTGETRQAVIGEDRKSVQVPSPHPRFHGRRSRVHLRKHLQQSLPSIDPPPATAISTTDLSSSDTPSPFHHLLSSAVASQNTCVVELDDVLEASFLDDLMDQECEGSSPTLTCGTYSRCGPDAIERGPSVREHEGDNYILPRRDRAC